MPFGYFGSKKSLAKFYPEPLHGHIVEPFAGSASYSCYWSAINPGIRVTLIDNNIGVIRLWRRLQRMTIDDLHSIECPPVGERCSDPLIMLSAFGRQGMACLNGREQTVTKWVYDGWGRTLSRVEKIIGVCRNWRIIHGDYTKCGNIKATWFVDPPYCNQVGTISTGMYRSQDMSWYGDLREWINSRPGMVIVCEQNDANWMPFVDFKSNVTNVVGRGTKRNRTELIYTVNQ